MTNGRNTLAMPSLGTAFMLGVATGTLMSHATAAEAAARIVDLVSRVLVWVA